MVNFFFLKYILETNMYNMSGDSKCYGNNFKMKQGLRHAERLGVLLFIEGGQGKAY